MMAMKHRQRSNLLQKISLIVLIPIFLPFIVIAYTLFFAHRILLYALVWSFWLPRGKDILLVYSDSPIWHEYITTQILPLIQGRVVTLNWSERRRWARWSLAVQLFWSFGTRREFNPLVVMFRPLKRARIFRFWQPFQAWKKGYTGHVERLRQEIFAIL